MELVKLIDCWNSMEAEIIKGALEAAGIPCIIQGSSFSAAEIGMGFGNSACAVPVLVRVEDLEEAKKAIASKGE